MRVEADETYVGGPRPGKPGRGAGGKSKVVGAVESGRGQARGAAWDGSGWPWCRTSRRAASKASWPRAVARPATIATDGWSGYGGLAAAGYAQSR